MKRRAISFITALVLCLSLCPMQAWAASTYKLTADKTEAETYNVSSAVVFDAGGFTYTVTGGTAVSVKSGGILQISSAGTLESTRGAGVEVLSGGALSVTNSGMTVKGTTYGLDVASGAKVEISAGTFTGTQGAIRTADNNFIGLLKSGCAFFDASGNPIPLDDVDKATTVVVKAHTDQDHSYRYEAVSYDPNVRTLSHHGICIYCGAETLGDCTFSFDGNSLTASCDEPGCTHTITIKIESSYVFDGTEKPPAGFVTVTLDGMELTEGTHYNLSYTPSNNVDAGVFSVTIEGIIYTGTFTMDCLINPFEPTIKWEGTFSPVTYNGQPIGRNTVLPLVRITVPGSLGTAEETRLKNFLQFSYRRTDTGEADGNFTPGLPTDAGTYQIKATLPQQSNYTQAETAQYLVLTIAKSSESVFVKEPSAKTLYYNRTAQQLVDRGELKPDAADAVVKFALSVNGGAKSVYSEEIPTGVNAYDTYEVWYIVEGANNYKDVEETEISGVEILPKELDDPVVQLEYNTIVYDGGFKEPKVTVIDRDGWTTLPSTKYEVTYDNNQYVSTDDNPAVVTVTDKDGNYKLFPSSDGEKYFNFLITASDQNALHITNQPNTTITYGDEFTLGTSGGSGSGTVTWAITKVIDGAGKLIYSADADNADDSSNPDTYIDDGSDSGAGTISVKNIVELDEHSGHIKIKGPGVITIQATKSGKNEGGDNYADATAEWTFTAVQKHVVAVVTAENKTYDGNTTATVHAIVPEQERVPGDIIDIVVTGDFDDENAGENKPVTVDTNQAKITLNGDPMQVGKTSPYNITFTSDSNTVTADIDKENLVIADPVPNNPLTYNRTAQQLLSSGLVVNPPNGLALADQAELQVEYALSENGDYVNAWESLTATDAGSYEIWYRVYVKGDGNYNDIPATNSGVTVTIQPKTVLAAELDITLSDAEPDAEQEGYTYRYTGSAIEPTVTVRDKSDTISPSDDGLPVEYAVIPSSEYTVTYSDNINVGTATVTVKDREGGNYTFETSQMVKFKITKGDQAELTSTPAAVSGLIYNGEKQNLITPGTASHGHLEYAVLGDEKDLDEENPVEENSDYQDLYFTPNIPQETGAGTYKVYYKVVGDGNHSDNESSDYYYLFVTIQPKTVITPVIMLRDKTDKNASGDGTEPESGTDEAGNGNDTESGYKDNYSVTYAEGDPLTPDVQVMDGGKVIDPDEYTVSYSNNINAGTATVHISDVHGGNYTINGETTFKIEKADARFDTEPAGPTDGTLSYNGKAQPLLTSAGTPVGGTAVYWVEGDPEPYSTEIPTRTALGTYKVFAKILGDANHNDSEVVKIEVEIIVNNVTDLTVELSYDGFQKTDGQTLTVKYTGTAHEPTVTVTDGNGNVIPPDEYTVSYSDNTNVGTAKVTITAKAGGNYRFGPKEETFEILAPELTLEGLTLSSGTLNPVFDPNTNTYTVSVASNVSSITITPMATAVSGVTLSYQIDGDSEFTAVPASGTIEVTGLEAGVDKTKTVTIKVTSNANEDDILEYKVSITRDIDDTPLVLTGLAVTGGKLNEEFDAAARSAYTMDVAYPVTKVTVMPAAADNVTLSYAIGDDERTPGDDEFTSVISGADIPVNNLPVGTTIVTIRVTSVANDSRSEEYTVKITREEDKTSLELESLAVSKCELNEEFAPAMEKYTVSAASDVSSVTITVEPEADADKVKLTYRIGESGAFAPVTNNTISVTGLVANVTKTVIIKVTSVVDPSRDKNYTVTITRAADNTSLELTDLSVSKCTLNETFDAATENYTVTAASDVSSVTITAVPKAGDAVKLTYQIDGSAFAPVTNNKITVRDLVAKEPKTVTIRVTSAADSSRSEDYTVTITREEDDTLLELVLTVSKGVLSEPSGATTKTESYTVSAESNVSSVIITAMPKASGDAVKLTYQIDGSAFAPVTGNKVTVNGLVATEPKVVTIKVTSIADPSHSKEYTVTITREEDDTSLKLTKLTSYSGTVTSQDTNHYEVSVESTVARVTITAVPEAGDAVKLTYQIDGNGAFFPATANNITVTDLELGMPKTVTIKVTSVANSSRSADYTVTITHKSESSGSDSAGGSTSGSANNTNTNTVPSTASGNGANAPSVSDSGTASVSIQTSVQNGTANTVVNSATANRLVNEAVSSQSSNVVIELEITGNVTKTEVSLPASAISRIGSETEASLTVSTPVADVVIPNGVLDTLSSAGGEVSVVTERMANTVVLALSANGQDIGTIPEGLTLTVPADNAGPGTVAVLIHEDGTRETIRKSVAGDGNVRIPLNGSAVVEIVDNSKAFEDVSAESWVSDAVAFASAHKLFNGTSKTTFSPELAMSRGMLATVLYNLEGSPEQSLTGAFRDIGSGDWYAESVSWAAENGIINGYGGGQFGPNDNITREQFAVMLWRYAGRPAAEQRVSSFVDADQISDYAVQAMSWATEKGILKGYGNGQLDPGGQATRAQAAQMLKNLIENT